MTPQFCKRLKGVIFSWSASAISPPEWEIQMAGGKGQRIAFRLRSRSSTSEPEPFANSGQKAAFSTMPSCVKCPGTGGDSACFWHVTDFGIRLSAASRHEDRDGRPWGGRSSREEMDCFGEVEAGSKPASGLKLRARRAKGSFRVRSQAPPGLEIDRQASSQVRCQEHTGYSGFQRRWRYVSVRRSEFVESVQDIGEGGEKNRHNSVAGWPY